MHRRRIFGRKPDRNTGFHIHFQRRWIKTNQVLVASGAEAQPIVESLLEHPESGNQGASFDAVRHRFRRGAGSQIPSPPHPARRHTDNAGKRYRLAHVPDSPGCSGCQAFRLSIDLSHPGVSSPQKDVHDVGLVFFQPARFYPDLMCGMLVFFSAESSYLHWVIPFR